MTMETTPNDVDTGSPMPEWIRQYRVKLNAINEAVEGFVQHLRALQDPQSAGEVEALLHFRLTQFRLDDRPATEDGRRRVAERATQFIDQLKYKVTESIQSFLSGIEFVLTLEAKKNKHGLVDLDSIDRRFVVITGDQAVLTDRAGLPEKHPLHAIPIDPRSPWLELGNVHTTWNAATGQQGTALPAWATVASIARRAEEARGELARRQREDAERSRRDAEEEERRRRLARTQEQLMEERLAKLEQLANQQERNAHASSCA
jgi:hypothetical protein